MTPLLLVFFLAFLKGFVTKKRQPQHDATVAVLAEWISSAHRRLIKVPTLHWSEVTLRRYPTTFVYSGCRLPPTALPRAYAANQEAVSLIRRSGCSADVRSATVGIRSPNLCCRVLSCHHVVIVWISCLNLQKKPTFTPRFLQQFTVDRSGWAKYAEWYFVAV